MKKMRKKINETEKRRGNNVKIIRIDGKNEEYVKLTPQLKEMIKFFKDWKGVNEHHVESVARGGKSGNGNRKNIAGKYHSLIHLLFGNLFPEEMQFFIEFWLRGRKKTWQKSDVLKLRRLIQEGEIEKAMDLSQFCSKRQNKLAEKFLRIIEKRKAKRCE